MGERKGTNKYYLPDYDPRRGGLNKFMGTHALRERASKLHLGILVIRFEMPFNIWCDEESDSKKKGKKRVKKVDRKTGAKVNEGGILKGVDQFIRDHPWMTIIGCMVVLTLLMVYIARNYGSK